MSARAGLALLESVREALLTDRGRRLARDIRRLLDDAGEAADEGSYAARLVARSFAAPRKTSMKKTKGTRRA